MNDSINISNDLEVAEKIISETDLFYYNQRFYTYLDKYWKPIEIDFIKKKILTILESSYKQNRVTNIIDIIRIKTLKQFNEINLNGKDWILNIKNGHYHLKTRKLIPHSKASKESYSTNLFNIEYKLDAKCPRWEKFVQEIFEGDKDKDDKIKLLQEYLGYCLTPSVKYQKTVLLLGTGSNGKSIIIEILEEILGKENYSNIELSQLSNKHYIVELQNKLVNFCSEIDHKGSFSSGIFKRIITGETLTGDAKFKHPIKFRPYCKLLFAANDLPKTIDTTRGYFRRIIILKFNRRFEGSEKDLNLKSELLREIDGIFNWILEGLERLSMSDEFTIPESSTDELDNYLESSSSVVSFINEKCEINLESDLWEGYHELYDDYRIFCANSGYRPFQKMNFKIEIEKHFVGKIIFNKTGPKGRYFQNVRIIKRN